MKNMKIKAKLIVGFTIITILAAAVGAVGVIGMQSLHNADVDMYNNNVLGMDSLGSIRENYALQRVNYRNFMIYDVESDYFQNALEKMSALEAEMDTYINTYVQGITQQEDRDIFDVFRNNYQKEFKKVKEQIVALSSQGLRKESMDYLASPDVITLSNAIDKSMNECYRLNVGYAKDAVDSNTSLAWSSTIILLFVLAFAIVLSVVLTLYISGLISKPLIMMTRYMKKVVTTGDTSLTQEDITLIDLCSTQKDETGECVVMTAAFVNRVLDIGKVLETVAGGDLTAELALLSEHDTMGTSLKKMITNLNNMFDEMNNASKQVSTGSKQIADGAQSLAQGATQQAAAAEELSASIGEVSNATAGTAQMAGQTAALAQAIKQNAEKGSKQMDQMLIAVQDIKEASKDISKVIKAIDDIAFQTNILALNAAVEAARAGQHGKGFAVVAEEVRNLAAKSAEAAKNTGGLITASMEKAELGANIAAETAASLAEIVTGINDSSRIIGDMASSAEEQATAVSQINKGIEQIAQVIQQNSSAAEESAAAAEEMSEQSGLLEGLIARFKLKNGRNYLNSTTPVKHLELPEKQNDCSTNGFADKY